jgi:hypothetical protein
MVMHTLDTITTDIGSVLLLEQHISPSSYGVVVEQVVAVAAVSRDHQVVLVHMLSKLFVLALTVALVNHLLVLPLVECATKFT